MSLMMRNPDIFYGYGRKRRVGRPRVRRGAGFFSNLGNALSGAHDFIKSHKLVSTIGNALGSVGVPYAGAIGKAAGLIGYGRRRRRVRRGMGEGLRRRRVVHRRRGGLNIRGILSSAHGFVRKHQLASKLLSHLGHPKAALAASSAGYGRRRRVVRRRRGGLSLRGLLTGAHGFVRKHQLASKLLSHIGHPKAALAASSLGYGRRRTTRRVHRRMPRHHGGANFFSLEQVAAPKF